MIFSLLDVFFGAGLGVVQLTVTTTESQPLAPSGTGEAACEVCVAPVPSVARTRSECRPGVASHAHSHWRQVSMPSAAASRAARQGPLSTLTWTAEMPRCG